MHWKPGLRLAVLAASGAWLAATFACSSETDDPFQSGTGGSSSTATGGSAPAATGGSTTLSGGSSSVTTGGAPAATGGAGQSSGGSAATTGGKTSGGATSTSGGASPASGGESANGGGAGTPASGGGSGDDTCPDVAGLEPFSFFVTSLKALQELSGSPDGFGGDLRYGEPDGLSGADKICSEIAERSMTCAGKKQWRAFLSTTQGGPDGGPVHAIDRVGDGPWYDRVGRLVAMSREALINQRPMGADPAIINDLPNEDGVPNHAPDGELVDNHDMLTGSNEMGMLYTTRADPLESTCKDWTSKEPWGAPRCGHTWPTGMGGPGGGGIPPGGGVPPGGGGRPGGGPGGIGDLAHWISALDEAGCAPGVNLVEMGPPMSSNPVVGSGGGYGGFYCFALEP